MKSLLIVCLALATGCSAVGTKRTVSSEMRLKLSCDYLRIDSDPYDNYQIVLFGSAASHFASFGAFENTDLNGAGEYVRQMQADRDIFRAVLHNGDLTMSTELHASGNSYQVRFTPYGNSGFHATDFWFHDCH